MIQITDFDYIQIKLASPMHIIDWGQKILPNGDFIGEISHSETINYRTFKPEMGGLFCERIFGPSINWECYCGKYRQVRKYKNFICDRCGVEVTQSQVRRYRMGFIRLNSPATHIWYLRSVPSFISLLLGEKRKDVEQKVYFSQSRDTTLSDTIEENDSEIMKFSNYFNLDNLYDFSNTLEPKVVGSELLQKELEALNLLQLSNTLRNKITFLKNVVTEKKEFQKEELEKELKLLVKRIRIIENFISTGSNPTWMILTYLPVIPPDLRPMIQMEGGKFATCDLNVLYRSIIIRNMRLNRFMTTYAPNIVINNEKRLIQEAVDSLIDNGKCRNKALGANNRPLRSLSDIIKGKQGRFRQNLLGKRVDYSGRSVIVVGPNLKLNQCGLPYNIAVELFYPFIVYELVNQTFIRNLLSAQNYIKNNKIIILQILKKLLKDHPVFLNRAPTLHRLGIQAFESIIVEGQAIRLHPLVCSSFNADFDGDQMAVHVPLSIEARTEAYLLMLAPYNFLSPATGEPVLIPSQDMVLGCYYLTSNNLKSVKGSNNYFANFDDVILAYNSNHLDLHALIWVRYNELVTHSKILLSRNILPDETYIEHYSNLQCRKNKNGSTIVQYVQTTPGRIIFNNTVKKALNLT